MDCPVAVMVKMPPDPGFVLSGMKTNPRLCVPAGSGADACMLNRSASALDAAWVAIGRPLQRANDHPPRLLPVATSAPFALSGTIMSQLMVKPPASMGCFAQARSEEHTSELQSLMRISYAAFCLTTKNAHTNTLVHMDTINST